MAEFLLEKGYLVHGLVRRTSTLDRSRISHLFNDRNIYNHTLFFHYADLEDTITLRRILRKLQPDEFYHLAGQSHVGLSFEIPESTCEQTGMATLRLLEIIRDLEKKPKFFHAASSEIFGHPPTEPQTESTPYRPVNPYGCAKAFATNLVQVYRQSYGLFCVNGIMFNHESPRRGENFVTRKVCRAAAAIKAKRQAELVMGDLGAARDWGHAKDYVRGMWLSLQQSQADDYIFATGKLHSVQELLDLAFGLVGLDWHSYVRVDARFLRPTESQPLVGDYSKALRVLGWRPETTFQQLVQEMIEAELRDVSS